MTQDVEGPRELVLAIFRLAVADCLGVAYGFDGPIPRKRITHTHDPDGALGFLGSDWAIHLGDMAGFQADVVEHRVRAGSPSGLRQTCRRKRVRSL
jgi:hypothetical protein